VKLIIQIPCLNEAGALPATVSDLPRRVPGFDAVEWLVVDDGSTDDTARVARACGVDHVVRLTAHAGLSAAFEAGMDAALKLGADVIVNPDGDNQYRGSDIARLVAPIVEGRADVTVGDRGIRAHAEFSRTKKALQLFGSWVVRHASATDVTDTTSGFRAYSRQAALRLNVVSRFTYTLETLIQAGHSDLAIENVPVGTNPRVRPSRLFGSTRQYVSRSAATIFRIYAMYEPLRVFLWGAVLFALVAMALFARFTWYAVTTDGQTGHVQSLIVAAAALVLAMQLAALAVIADLLRANRVLAERTLSRVRRLELHAGVPAETLDEEEESDQKLAAV